MQEFLERWRETVVAINGIQTVNLLLCQLIGSIELEKWEFE